MEPCAAVRPFVVTDTKCSLWSCPPPPTPGRGRKLGEQAERGGEFLSSARTAQCRDSRGSQPAGHESAAPPGSAPTRPAPSGVERTLSPPTKSGRRRRHPGQAAWRLNSEHPSPRRRIPGTPRPAGCWNLDTMDLTCTLGLWLLPSLLVGTALGDAAQDPPGITHRPGDPPARGALPSSWPGSWGALHPRAVCPLCPGPCPRFLCLYGPPCSEAAGTEPSGKSLRPGTRG